MSLLKTILEKRKKLKGEDPCWDNYKMVGLKPNGDPNCVGPVKETTSMQHAEMVTINSPGHHLHNTPARVFYKHDDGRVNVQVTHSKKKGHVTNLSLKPSQFVKGVVNLDKEVKEDIEPIEEISKDAANKYMWAAMDDRKQTDAKVTQSMDKNRKEFSMRRHKNITKLLAKSDKRSTGIGRALERLKEDTQVDEGKMGEKAAGDLDFHPQAQDTKPPFDGPYKKKPSVIVDKSGAKHTMMSRVRDLARRAQRSLKKEDTQSENNESISEGSVDDNIKKVVNIYSKHRQLEDKAKYVGDKAARAKHKEGAKRASDLLAKMRAKKAAADADKPKPVVVHHDYSADIAKDYKDQEARRGIGHVRDSVEVIVDPNVEMLDELKLEATSAAIRMQRALQKAKEDRERQQRLAKPFVDKVFGNKEKEMKKLSTIREEAEQKVHPNALHVKPVKVDGQTKYHVHAVGKNFAHGIKVGERLSDSELDDFSEMGGKIKHVK